MKKLTAIFGVFVLCAVYCTGFAFGDNLTDNMNAFRNKMSRLTDVFGKYCNDNNMSIDCELLDGTDFRNAFACNFKENIDKDQLLADLRKYCDEKFTKSNPAPKSSTTTPTSGTTNASKNAATQNKPKQALSHSGTVTDGNGKPLAGVCVIVYEVSVKDGKEEHTELEEVKTNNKGEFKITKGTDNASVRFVSPTTDCQNLSGVLFRGLKNVIKLECKEQEKKGGDSAANSKYKSDALSLETAYANKVEQLVKQAKEQAQKKTNAKK